MNNGQTLYAGQDSNSRNIHLIQSSLFSNTGVSQLCICCGYIDSTAVLPWNPKTLATRLSDMSGSLFCDYTQRIEVSQTQSQNDINALREYTQKLKRSLPI